MTSDRTPELVAEDADRAARASDQTLADLDQSGSEADRAASEADKVASERDDALTGIDQNASDRDQLAADRELDGLHPLDGARRQALELSSSERETGTAERGAAAALRAQAAVARLNAADRRDEASRLRDLAAQARDRAADERESAGSSLAGPAVQARVQAAADRARAAADRERAATDREQAAADRQHARAALTQAHLDELTGAYRRGVGTMALQREINRARHSGGRLVLTFVDVDGLKQVNDRHGHAAGDLLLMEAVRTIRSRLRSYDPVVRVGGDEFVCAFSDFGLDEARERFDLIHADLAKRGTGSSISAGFAELQRNDTLDDLIARGDADLYEAKRRRKAKAGQQRAILSGNAPPPIASRRSRSQP